MTIRSGWVRAYVVVPPKQEDEGHTTCLERVRVEIDLRDCAHISTAITKEILASAGIKPKRRIIYHAETTHPLRSDFTRSDFERRFLNPIEFPIPTTVLVQIRLEFAARRYFANIGTMRWSPRRNAATMKKFRRHVSAAVDLFEIPHPYYFVNRTVAPVLRGLHLVQSDGMRKRAEALFTVLSTEKPPLRKRGPLVGWIFDFYLLREALKLLVDYAEQASTNAHAELQRTPNQAFKNEGRGSLNFFVSAVCRIWRDDLGRRIATSVTPGRSASGPLVRFVCKSLKAIGVEKTDDATRALIRRVTNAEGKKP